MDEAAGRKAVADFDMGASQPPPAVMAASPAGCAKDTDCKGNRVCNAGACVEPAAP